MDFNYDQRMGKNIREIRKKKGWTQESADAICAGAFFYKFTNL
ncbi:hypothetical protein [Caproiciproducens galactitolivorans]|nr:hypothetical protein [Caproiciproducens galactitolivorans]